MKTRFFTTLISTLALTGVYATSAQAAGFKFTTNYSTTDTTDWTHDITLKSVEFNNKTYSNFSLVNKVEIQDNNDNDPSTGKDDNTGAASSDKGDKASGIQVHNPTASNLATSLGNLNLSNIVDTEDKGNFTLDLFFAKPADNFLFFERGKNSKLDVQAVFTDGSLGSVVNLYSKNWDYAGYQLNTKEIPGAQEVGSFGLSLLDLGVTDAKSFKGLRLISKFDKDFDFNGPDFKVVATAVPEPTTVLGLGLVGAALAMSRRKKAQ